MVGQKSTKAQSVFFHIFSCVLGFIMVYPLLWLLPTLLLAGLVKHY